MLNPGPLPCLLYAEVVTPRAKAAYWRQTTYRPNFRFDIPPQMRILADESYGSKSHQTGIETEKGTIIYPTT